MRGHWRNLELFTSIERDNSSRNHFLFHASKWSLAPLYFSIRQSNVIQYRTIFDSRRPLSILVEEFLTGASLGKPTDYDRGHAHFGLGTWLA
jgi:hypothetical protein